jgi:hypothetical protein
VIHFFLLGSVCFALTSGWPAGDAALSAVSFDSFEFGEEPLEISAERTSRLIDEWVSSHGSAPSSYELEVLIANHVDEEILFREALRLGLNRTDPVVRQRLAQNMLFLAQEEGNESEGEQDRVRRALDLGMDRTDLVVRRRLIQRMQAALESRAVQPTVDEIRDYAAANPQRFTSLLRYRLSYAFESAFQSRGASTITHELESSPADDGHPKNASERELPHQGLFTLTQIEQRFGVELALRIPAIVQGSRAGPFAVAQGRYWIRVDEVLPARLHAFDSIRERVVQAIMLDRRRRARSDAMNLLRGRYRIRVPIVANVGGDRS